jgi:type IV secretory pathway VirJ component
LASALAVLGLLVFATTHMRFLEGLGSALLGREGAYAGEAPSAGPALARLPLIETPSSRPGPALVVLYSGDGGWARATTTLARDLAQAGAPTVGIDSLRYFWPGRTTAEAAGDLDAVVARYRAVWGRDQVVLAGYSFGADALPVLWPLLKPATRAEARAVVLIGASASAEMMVRPRSWLDLKAADAVPLAPALARPGAAPAVCVYGTGDRATACPRLLPASRLIGLPGGHHFGGDYAAVARAVLRASRL